MTPQEREADLELQEKVSHFIYKPSGYVDFVYPWREPGTRLERFDGPDVWQRETLDEIGDELKARALGQKEGPVQMAIASGHGIGKTATLAWITEWWLATRPHPQIVVTSNTRQQLETKTWRELEIWRQISLTGHWFQHTAQSHRNKIYPDTWRANAIPWTKERSEAFAGTHADHVLVIYDEASLIDKVIWEVTEGAMTTGECLWIAFGNPTRSSGAFHEAFHRQRHRWITRHIDSRTAMIPKVTGGLQKFRQWIEDYGEDSDFVKVRVRGMFPDEASLQFIPTNLAEAARERVITPDIVSHAPCIIGVDVARYGDDQSVICKRQGLSVKPLMKLRNRDTMTLASLVAQESRKFNADAIFVDVVGIGAGVVDRLRQLGHDNVIEVNNGSRAEDEKKYANKRAECWARMREWLALADIPDDNELHDDLVGLEYGYDMRERIRLEKKEDMKARGLASPDCADALACTFAQKVVTQEDRLERIRLEMIEKANRDNVSRRIGTRPQGYAWRHAKTRR